MRSAGVGCGSGHRAIVLPQRQFGPLFSGQRIQPGCADPGSGINNKFISRVPLIRAVSIYSIIARAAWAFAWLCWAFAFRFYLFLLRNLLFCPSFFSSPGLVSGHPGAWGTWAWHRAGSAGHPGAVSGRLRRYSIHHCHFHQIHFTGRHAGFQQLRAGRPGGRRPGLGLGPLLRPGIRARCIVSRAITLRLQPSLRRLRQPLAPLGFRLPGRQLRQAFPFPFASSLPSFRAQHFCSALLRCSIRCLPASARASALHPSNLPTVPVAPSPGRVAAFVAALTGDRRRAALPVLLQFQFHRALFLCPFAWQAFWAFRRALRRSDLSSVAGWRG